MSGASVAWGWLGALLGAQGVCAPRWHGLGRAWAEPGGGWAEPGPRSSCSGSERPQCGEAQESLNPILGRKGAMVRHEETEGLIYLFIYLFSNEKVRRTCTVLFPPSLTGQGSSSFQVFLFGLLLFINNFVI